MPTVISYTPPWLSRPSPGFDLFSPPTSTKPPNGGSSRGSSTGPNRTIAARGTEIFVALGVEIRWSDLVLLKEKWESPEQRQEQDDESVESEESNSTVPTYRILKVPVSRPIQQLVISPRGEYLAILTSHTIHVAVLPDPSHLSSKDTKPIRLKTFQLGPTAHVLDQAPIASALWHPLGASGSCLVTVTVDAVVRLWELDRGNRWSFDNPALAIDLRKLVDCVSSNDDYSPSKYGANKGYSPDSLEMEVTSACFGGQDYDGESCWASMTLWVAMKEGDIYALCPLLPSKWQPSPSLIPGLSTSIVEKVACSDAGEARSADTSQSISQQLQWITDIDNQEPIPSSDRSLFQQVDMYKRPAHPGPVPRLQGPFVPEPYPDGDFVVTDVFAIAATLQSSDNASDVGDEPDDKMEGMSIGIVGLATSDGKVHICLDVDGVEGQWLSAKSKKAQILDDQELSLLLVETLELQQSESTQCLTFTPDVQSKYSFFVTQSTGVSHLALDSWIQRLQDELGSSADSGIAFRVGTIVESIKTTIEQPIKLLSDGSTATASEIIPTVLALEDSDLGYFLLTTSPSGQPHSTTLDATDLLMLDLAAPSYAPSRAPALPLPEPRPTYQPASEFYATSTLPHFLDRHLQGRARSHRALQDPLRLSPATLELMMEAHRVLTHETHALGAAAAQLFRRCERLRDELREQVRRVDGIAGRVDALVGDDADYAAGAEAEHTPAELVLRRLEAGRLRQDQLVARHAALRRKLGRASEGRALNRREEEWVREVRALEENVAEGGKSGARLEELRRLQVELARDGRESAEDTAEDAKAAAAAATAPRASSQVKKAMSAQIEALLDRETALVDATRGKLDRLKVVL